MTRKTPGITTALASAAAEQARTISSALGLPGGEQLISRDVAHDSPAYDNQHVTGIGRDKAEKIRYRALTTKFTSSTKYATGTLAATADLHGASSPEYAAVDRAWAAVNVK